MRSTRCRLSRLLPLAGLALWVHAAPPDGAEKNYFWTLGAGTYGTPPAGADADTVLTHARFDWQMIAFGSQVDLSTINRCLDLNPQQRFLVRLWPRQGDDDFLAYRYKPGVRERIDRAIADQVRRVLDHISRPEQVVAFTFLEELPDRWHPFHRGKTDAQVSAVLEPYRTAIEKERGQPLVYDETLKGWFWTKFVESLDGIHAAIRANAGEDRLVLFWPRFDWWDEALFKTVIRPGGADGVFLYVWRPDVWSERVAVAEANRWPFFSQLSHNTAMKNTHWAAAVELPYIRSRYNLGYFYYGGGNPLRPHFFDNKAVDPVNNVSRFSTPVHLRWFAADRNLGWDVFKRHIAFQPLVDFLPAGKHVGDAVDVYAVVPNPLLEGHYPEAADQSVTGVTVRLELPDGLELESGAAVVELGELGPSRHRAPAPGSLGVAHWRLKVMGVLPAEATITLAVEGSHPRLGTITGRTRVSGREDDVLPAFRDMQVVVSGQGWAEPGFGLAADIRPAVTMRTAHRAVSRPSLTDGEFTVTVNLGSYKDNSQFYRLLPGDPVPTNDAVNRMVYNGTLPPHSTLVVGHDGRATLALTRPLLERRFLADGDPGVSNGYHHGTYAVNRPIPPGEKVVVAMSGKKAGRVNSHVIVYFTCADTGVQQACAPLTNRFGEEWRSDIAAEMAPPFTNSILRSVALYRYPGNAEGTIWYGSLKADLASDPEAGQDVSALLEGERPLLRAGRYNVITYFDEDTQQPEGSKVVVRLHPGVGP